MKAISKFNLVLICVVFLILIVGYIFFVNDSSPTSAQLKIGIVLPETGPASVYGQPVLKSILLAVDEINQNGGVNGKKIQAVVEDGVCDAKNAINAAQKLIDSDGVRFLITGCSTESLTIAPLANQKRVIQFATLTSSSTYSSAGDYSFRTFMSSDILSAKHAEFAFNQLNSKKIAILYEKKEYPESIAQSFKKKFVELGGTLLSEQTFAPDETDFGTYLAKIQSVNPDTVYFSAQSPATHIRILKRMQELSIINKYILLSNDPATTKEVFVQTKGLNANIFSVDHYLDRNNPLTATFFEKYKSKYKEYPESYYYQTAAAYEIVYLIRDAVMQCNDDTTCTKNLLYATKSRIGAWGTIGFDENGDAIAIAGVHFFDINGLDYWRVLK